MLGVHSNAPDLFLQIADPFLGVLRIRNLLFGFYIGPLILRNSHMELAPQHREIWILPASVLAAAPAPAPAGAAAAAAAVVHPY